MYCIHLFGNKVYFKSALWRIDFCLLKTICVQKRSLECKRYLFLAMCRWPLAKSAFNVRNNIPCHFEKVFKYRGSNMRRSEDFELEKNAEALSLFVFFFFFFFFAFLAFSFFTFFYGFVSLLLVDLCRLERCWLECRGRWKFSTNNRPFTYSLHSPWPAVGKRASLESSVGFCWQFWLEARKYDTSGWIAHA